MEITSKEVITLTSVEIGFDEFMETMHEVIEYWLAHQEVKSMNFRYNMPHYVEYMKDFMKKYSQEWDRLEVAMGVFKSFNCEMATLVMSQIAEDNGYKISNYGTYDKGLNVRVSTFRQNGRHI